MALCKDHPEWSSGKIGRELGLTRNVVVGVLVRNGLRSGGKSGWCVPRRAGPRQEPEGCRYIHGDPDQPGWHYCNAKQRVGSSYCSEHHLRCYQAKDEPASSAMEAA